MDASNISREILEIRERLDEIEEERARLLEGEYGRKTALQGEEAELRARLGDLRVKLSAGDPERRESPSRSSQRTPEIPPM